ncbi:MAG: GNAT family N-acetyltransferase [Fusobacterium sp.]|uniref:GNAT family N-acetyltransferase n=1 Tax=Fusobacterium sp. TaxID=68766 RepID=UPI0026DD7E7E|nr:GNAT family N-acetyltransferase [Fusobacterium sp.]MDO4690252.1 GNAT family N-acetyltransferase [Fusobacterium sp.]
MNNQYRYRLAKMCDLDEIAEIHIQEFSDYFLTAFGKELIYKFYKCYLENKEIFVVVENKEKILGFILGSSDSNSRKNFFKENFNKISLIILKELLKGNKVLWGGIWKRISFIKEAFFIKFFSRSGEKKLPESKSQRLLSIAIRKEFRGENIAYNMEKFFCEALIKNNIKKVGLSVKSENERAIHFYKKCGYEIEKKEEKSIYFIKNLI